MENIFYVYIYMDPSRDFEVIYVGKGRKLRANYHLKRKDRHPLTNRIKSIRSKGLEPVIDFVVQGSDEAFALRLEQEAIKFYGRKDLGEGTLLNLTDGGETNSNLSELSRLKISLKALGNKHALGVVKSVETRKKISIGNSGKVRTDLVKAQISSKVKLLVQGENNPFFGKVHSEASKAKISLAKRNPSEETRARLRETTGKATRFKGESYPSKKAAYEAIGVTKRQFNEMLKDQNAVN